MTGHPTSETSQNAFSLSWFQSALKRLRVAASLRFQPLATKSLSNKDHEEHPVGKRLVFVS